MAENTSVVDYTKKKKKKTAAHGVGSCLRFDKTTKLINFIIEMENPCM